MIAQHQQNKPIVTPLRELRFKLRPFSELEVGPEPLTLVQGLVPRVGLTVVWGPPKSGKSFWIFDLVMHVALGREYRGRRVQAGPVVYLAFEGAHGFNARAEAFRQTFLGDEDDANQFPFYLIAAEATLARDHATIVADIRSQMSPSDMPAVVVLDTLNRSLNGDENLGKDMTAYVNAAGAISSAFECAVIIVHHCGHDASRPRGFSGLSANVDCAIEVKKQSGLIVAKVTAAKEMPDGDSVVSRLEQVTIGIDSDGAPISSCVVRPAEAPGPAARGWPKGFASLRDALDAIMLAQDYQHQPTDGGNPVKAALVDQVRQQHRKGYVHHGDGDRSEAERKAWRRQFTKACDSSLVQTEVGDDGNTYVWLSVTS
jgi:hypothetical protein